MTIFTTANELAQYIDNHKLSGKNIGFVPTMGALHQGHISLVTESKKANDITIVSIFVNPTQFNNPEDFAKYPNTLSADTEMLIDANCEILYLPSVEELYPLGIDNLISYNINGLDIHLEGASRPGHFQGVCNVVHQLLLHTKPHHLYMGAKDYQQCMVVHKLIEVTQLPIILHVCPTLRESSGLAMSSRNMRLSEKAKIDAAIIYKCLQHLQNNKTNNFTTQKEICEQWLIEKGFTLEYIILAHATNLQVLENFDIKQPMVILFAAWLDRVRLIDNMVLN
jgi:pantoate--beta-alanine ligase